MYTFPVTVSIVRHSLVFNPITPEIILIMRKGKKRFKSVRKRFLPVPKRGKNLRFVPQRACHKAMHDVFYRGFFVKNRI